jgi:hypothetical protein
MVYQEGPAGVGPPVHQNEPNTDPAKNQAFRRFSSFFLAVNPVAGAVRTVQTCTSTVGIDAHLPELPTVFFENFAKFHEIWPISAIRPNMAGNGPVGGLSSGHGGFFWSLAGANLIIFDLTAGGKCFIIYAVLATVKLRLRAVP